MISVLLVALAVVGSGSSWEVQLGSGVSAVDVSPDGDVVAAGTDGGTLYLLDGSGQVLWQRDIGSSVRAVGISNALGIAVAGCDDYKTHAFDLEGNELWAYETGFRPEQYAFVDDGILMAGGYSLVMLDANGSAVWNKEFSQLVVDVSVGGGKIAVGLRYELDLLDTQGNVIWSVSTMDYISYELYNVRISSDAQRISASSTGGDILMFDGSGNLLWQRELFATGPMDMDPDASLIVLGGLGSIYVLDGDGNYLWDGSVHSVAKCVALRKDSGRVFAVNTSYGGPETLFSFDLEGNLMETLNLESECMSMDAGQGLLAVGLGDGRLLGMATPQVAEIPL